MGRGLFSTVRSATLVLLVDLLRGEALSAAPGAPTSGIGGATARRVRDEAGRGAIVNVTSEAGLRGSAAGTAYTASKHAVIGLTRSTAVLYAPKGIRTDAVAPGPTATGIDGGIRSDFAAERLGPFFGLIPPVATAETVASSITWLLSDDAENINGQVLASDGGWSAQ